MQTERISEQKMMRPKPYKRSRLIPKNVAISVWFNLGKRRFISSGDGNTFFHGKNFEKFGRSLNPIVKVKQQNLEIRRKIDPFWQLDGNN
jgi:hypothetical protein